LSAWLFRFSAADRADRTLADIEKGLQARLPLF